MSRMLTMLTLSRLVTPLLQAKLQLLCGFTIHIPSLPSTHMRTSVCPLIMEADYTIRYEN